MKRRSLNYESMPSDYDAASGVISDLALRNPKLAGALSYVQRTLDEQHMEAFTNPITGAKNMRQLEKDVVKLNGHERRAYERGIISPETGLYVALLDIDHFKSFNDDFGHDVGDKVLKITTEILQSTQRPEDRLFAYHLHGEEKAALFTAPDDIAALRVADRYRRAVAEKSVSLGSPRQITESIGVTRFEKEEDLPKVLKRADKLLYRAKEAGRNRVCVGRKGSRRVIIYPN